MRITLRYVVQEHKRTRNIKISCYVQAHPSLHRYGNTADNLFLISVWKPSQNVDCFSLLLLLFSEGPMCVCVYLFACVYICLQVSVHLCIYVCKWVCMYVYMCVWCVCGVCVCGRFRIIHERYTAQIQETERERNIFITFTDFKQLLILVHGEQHNKWRSPDNSGSLFPKVVNCFQVKGANERPLKCCVYLLLVLKWHFSTGATLKTPSFCWRATLKQDVSGFGKLCPDFLLDCESGLPVHVQPSLVFGRQFFFPL